ncbi:hypothetical protein S7711_09944 [Stachybotrys chartarum IBT 7711]|uniref:Endosomal spry domain-containing protein n=1 Tax=Stachybotrys chartarum (strain CBS 109288 / IBT 7711) TaxID=1280523 RepID=A0A084AHP8_STACB|nr:hypothetical protein S7711_09944 [Stachybotrys chartarum IBT 7711]KFA51084.1 hypothetical protein S40293_08399 [Stachybotrys chartarum IBT 40293]KFA78096.1 hypothetical protein S40288_05662 [Stachybotrys chartarum IBT 40288]
MAPAIRDVAGRDSSASGDALGAAHGPLGEARTLFARDEQPNPASGVLDPHDINNVGFFVLFALIGVAFVATGIWFFFWAKNGGFHFQEKDWDEYKSTVLRRRGPNGTILSNATAPTDLGGGSVYKDVHDDDGTTVITESTALSGITAGASDIAAREKRRRKQEQRDRERRKRRGDKSKEKSGARHVGNDGVEDEDAEKEAKQHLRSYRHERPARVGGLNKEAEGSTWDGSTNPSASTAATSELLSNRQSTPTSTPTKGIRKVYSTAERTADREAERIRAEARRLRDEGRSARRDFSYQRSGDSALSESLLESGMSSMVSGSNGTGSELGTKSYHHPMPELREQRQREREERRARRGGYRRGRGEDTDDF